MFERNIFVSDEMIRCKAFEILEENNTNNPIDNPLNLKLSNGWLHKFKKRNKFKRYYCSGESADLNVTNIIQDLPNIIQELRNFSLNDIWNADEFGLMYKMAPNST